MMPIAILSRMLHTIYKYSERTRLKSKKVKALQIMEYEETKTVTWTNIIGTVFCELIEDATTMRYNLLIQLLLKKIIQKLELYSVYKMNISTKNPQIKYSRTRSITTILLIIKMEGICFHLPREEKI